MSSMIAGRYTLISSLGEGGMADVYLGQDTILNRQVAIKILRGELSKDPITLLRFQREAGAVSKLHHPNVVEVYDVGEYNYRHYIVMEYVKGRTLKQLILQRGALHQDEAVDIMIQLTSAVQHAHEHHIIHRDIKPQNVLVKDDGTIKITDFGIALAHDAIQLTQADAVLGSAHYLAPETTRGETINHQVDIYALGIVFYELLRGSVPFKGDNPVQIAMKHLREEIPSIKEFNPMIAQSVENIIIKASAKDRTQRYQSAKEMLYDLEHCLDLQNQNVKKIEIVQPIREESNLEREKELRKARIKREKVKSKVVEIKEEKPKKSSVGKWMISMFVVIAIIAMVVWFGMEFIKSQQIVEIPNVVGKTKEEAMSQLQRLGFSQEMITIQEELTDDKAKDTILNQEPTKGNKQSIQQGITLTVSKGTYYVVKDYTNRLYEEVLEELKQQLPYARIEVEKRQTTTLKPGYIIEQSGVSINEKLDPQKVVDIKLVVTESVSFQIPSLVGKSVNEAKQILEEKGITPVLYPMAVSQDEEVEKGVVTKVDPAEGSWYVQEGENTITLYYYE